MSNPTKTLLADEIRCIVGERPGIVRNVLQELLLGNTDLADEIDLDPKKVAVKLRNMTYTKQLSRDSDGHYTLPDEGPAISNDTVATQDKPVTTEPTPPASQIDPPAQSTSALTMLEKQGAAVLAIITENPGLANGEIRALLPEDIWEEGDIVDDAKVAMLVSILVVDRLVSIIDGGAWAVVDGVVDTSKNDPRGTHSTDAQSADSPMPRKDVAWSLLLAREHASQACEKYLESLNDPVLDQLMDAAALTREAEASYLSMLAQGAP